MNMEYLLAIEKKEFLKNNNNNNNNPIIRVCVKGT